MLALVENARRKQLAWIGAILDHNRWKPARLAREAGINHATLSKFLNDKLNIAQLNTMSVEKIARVGGIPPYQTRPPEPARGFSEEEVHRYWTAVPDTFVQGAVNGATGDRNGLAAWVLSSRALEHAGYLPGDILIEDSNAEPENGDVVRAELPSVDGRAGTVVMRIYEEPYLIASTSDPMLQRPLHLARDQVRIVGVVIGSLRARRAA